MEGEHDLETAKFLFQEGGYLDIVLIHVHQAVEKYIKGFLIYNGWKLKKVHDLETLITEVMKFDKNFEVYLDFGRKLTAFYYEERYPLGPIPSYSKEEVEEILEMAEKIIEKLKGGLNLWH